MTLEEANKLVDDAIAEMASLTRQVTKVGEDLIEKLKNSGLPDIDSGMLALKFLAGCKQIEVGVSVDAARKH